MPPTFGSPPRDDAPGLALLVVSAQARHADAVIAAAGGWPLPTRIDVAGSAFDGLGRVVASAAHLAVLDASLDGVGGQALATQFSRVRPGLALRLFDDEAADHPPGPWHVWPWDELQTVLDHWYATLAARALDARRTEASR